MFKFCVIKRNNFGICMNNFGWNFYLEIFSVFFMVDFWIFCCFFLWFVILEFLMIWIFILVFFNVLVKDEMYWIVSLRVVILDNFWCFLRLDLGIIFCRLLKVLFNMCILFFFFIVVLSFIMFMGFVLFGYLILWICLFCKLKL